MPLIAKKTKVQVEELRIKIASDLKAEIAQYCQAFALGDLSHFFSEAALYILGKDKEWQDKKKNLQFGLENTPV